MYDERTSHLDLPLPHIDNDLSDDVGRLRESLSRLDGAAERLKESMEFESTDRRMDFSTLSDSIDKAAEALGVSIKNCAENIQALQAKDAVLLKDMGTFTEKLSGLANKELPAKLSSSGGIMTGNLTLSNDRSISFTNTYLNPRINLYTASHAIGVQKNGLYFRSNKHFHFYIGGTHQTVEADSGGGVPAMALTAATAVFPGTVNAAQFAGVGCLYPGFLHLSGFRPGELPKGFYFCNGDQYTTTTAQGKVLAALPANFRTDMGIKTASGKINLPKLFHTDGRGFFLRAVNGTARKPGNVEGDAIRNITGTLEGVAGATGQAQNWGFKPQQKGAFLVKKQQDIYNNPYGTYNTQTGGVADFNASLVVPTATENRPLNLGLTPAIYLGV